MNKIIYHLGTLLIITICSTFIACEHEPPGLYGAMLTGIALRNETYVIEVDSTQPPDMRRFVVPSISTDSLFGILQMGGWAETEAYGLYLDGRMTENLLSSNYCLYLAFTKGNTALLCMRFYGKQEIQYSYNEVGNILTLSHMCLPSAYFEIVRKQEVSYSTEANKILAISDKEMLLIGPGGLYDSDFDPPAPYSLRVFTHVSETDVEKWKGYYKASCE